MACTTRTSALSRLSASAAAGAVVEPLSVVVVTGRVCFDSLEHAAASRAIASVQPDNRKCLLSVISLLLYSGPAHSYKKPGSYLEKCKSAANRTIQDAEAV